MAAAAEVRWVGIAFAEDGTFVLGPSRGDPEEARRERVTIAYDGAAVGELWADGTIRLDELEQVAALIAPARPHRLGHGRRGLGAVATRTRHPSIEGASLDRGGYLVRGIASLTRVITRRLGRGEGSRALVPRTSARYDSDPHRSGAAALPSLAVSESAIADSRDATTLEAKRLAVCRSPGSMSPRHGRQRGRLCRPRVSRLPLGPRAAE